MERACHEELDPLAVAAVGVGGRPLAGADAGDRPGGGGAAERLHPRAAAVVRGAGGSEGPPGSPGAGVRLPRRRPPGRWTGGGDPGKETRRRANTAEQKRAQIAADFTDHVSDLINWMYRDLAHLEGEREDQAIRTMHLALYVISAALQTQKIDESMRYLLRAFWNEFQPTFDESVYQALCAKQIMFAEIGETSEKRLGSFWRNLLDNLPPERRVGKDDDLQELLDDTNRLYNYFRDDSAPGIDFAKEIEPYWVAIRLPEEPEEPEEDDEDEEPEEESKPWTDYYEKTVPAGNGGGYYQFCKVQFKDGGSPYAYLTGGLPLAVGDFVVVPVGNRNAEKTGRMTDVFVCSAQDAPYPPEKAKFVLRKSERSAAPEKSET